MTGRMGRIAAAAVATLLAGMGAGAARGGEEPIRIGVIAPLSGTLAPYGKGCLDGMRIRINEANDAGGVKGRPIRLIVEDNKGDKTESKNAYTKLVGTDEVAAVMGPVTSTNTLALRRDAKKLRVPVITPTATNDKVTHRNPYLFRSCFKDSFQGRVMAGYLLREKKVKKAAVMVDENSDYSKGLSKSFAEAFARGGGTVAAEESYRQKDTEFGAQLNRVKASGAEVIFVPGYPPEVPLIIKQAKVIGFDGRLCGADGWDNPAVLQGSGPNLVGCLLTGMFSPEDERPVVKRFLALCEKRLEKRPGTFEAQGYDTASLLVEALGRGATPEAVREGLQGIRNFEAVTGTITITEDGDAEKSAVILTVRRDDDGTYVTRYVTTIDP